MRLVASSVHATRQLQVEPDPQSYWNVIGSLDGTAGTGEFPQMMLVAGAIAMVPFGAIEVGKYYSNPLDSGTGPYNGFGSPIFPSGPPVNNPEPPMPPPPSG